MKDTPEWVIAIYFSILCILGIVILYAVEFKSNVTELKTQAVEHGYARYNSKTAEFEWIKNNN